jgi:hypothetical protein
MLRLRLQRLGSLLGLIAILMSTLAPTISQALAAREQLDSELHVYCTVAGTANGAATDTTHPSSHPALHLDACAYCGLAAHLAGLPPAGPLPAPAMALTQALPVNPQTEAPALARYRTAQPRAPPTLS